MYHLTLTDLSGEVLETWEIEIPGVGNLDSEYLYPLDRHDGASLAAEINRNIKASS